jgi:hypothetical protein
MKNPLSLRGKEALLGAGLVAGVVGVAMIFRSTPAVAAGSGTSTNPTTPAPGTVVTSSGGTTTLPATPTGGGSGAPLPPTAGGPTAPTPQTFTVTEANSGSTISMHVGDTLAVVLDLVPPTTDYNYSLVGTNLTTGILTDVTNQTFQTWTATATGTATITYTPVGGSGANVVFVVSVT